MLLYTLDLRLVNRRAYPVWFVMRYWGEKPLPPTDRLVVPNPGESFQFGLGVLSIRERGDVYGWDKARSRCIVCLCYGDFVACRIAANSELHVDDCQINAWAPIREFEVWEVSDILLNDKSPLQEWLAPRIKAPEGHYATLTDSNRDPRSPTEILHGAARQPVDDVASIKLNVTGRWTIPIAGIESN